MPWPICTGAPSPKRQPMLLYLLPHSHSILVQSNAESGSRVARCRQLVCICEAKRAQLHAPPCEVAQAKRLGKAGRGS